MRPTDLLCIFLVKSGTVILHNLNSLWANIWFNGDGFRSRVLTPRGGVPSLIVQPNLDKNEKQTESDQGFKSSAVKIQLKLHCCIIIPSKVERATPKNVQSNALRTRLYYASLYLTNLLTKLHYEGKMRSHFTLEVRDDCCDFIVVDRRKVRVTTNVPSARHHSVTT